MNIDIQTANINTKSLTILIVDELPGRATTFGCYLIQPDIEPDLVWGVADTSDVLGLSQKCAPDLILLNVGSTEIDRTNFITDLQLRAGTYHLPPIAILQDIKSKDSRVDSILATRSIDMSSIAITPSVNIQTQVEQQLRERTQSQELFIQELAETSELLRQRNQELDAFAAIASHDLRAPLRGIANLATWLVEDLADSLTPDTRQQFDLLQTRVQRMDDLIEDLLAYARAGKDRFASVVVDVDRLLTQIIDFLAVDNEFTIEIATQMPIITTDRLALQQVLSNLIGNAVKHHHRLDGRVQINVRTQPNCYLFEIVDDGPGIAVQDRERIFEVFQTLQPQQNSPSTGMGLAIVKKTVELHGGRIWVDSTIGVGSKFSFTWAIEQL